MVNILDTLKCRFTTLVVWYATRSSYRVGVGNYRKELELVRRYIFFLESGCANSTEFYQQAVAYVNSLTAISSTCINCE